MLDVAETRLAGESPSASSRRGTATTPSSVSCNAGSVGNWRPPNATTSTSRTVRRRWGILGALLAYRIERAEEIGYEPTEHGAFVDWDALEHNWVSSTERAAVVVARGIAMVECQGGWSPSFHKVLAEAVSRT